MLSTIPRRVNLLQAFCPIPGILEKRKRWRFGLERQGKRLSRNASGKQFSDALFFWAVGTRGQR